jgi:hypothetical protein
MSVEDASELSPMFLIAALLQMEDNIMASLSAPLEMRLAFRALPESLILPRKHSAEGQLLRPMRRPKPDGPTSGSS